MVDLRTRHRSFAVAGAVLVCFVGLAHEFVGATLFPWGPAVFGGPVGWHAVGLACVVAGLALLGGTLEIARLPVVALSVCVAAIGVAITAYTAAVHRQFHFFAATLVLASVVVAVCYPRAERATAT